MGFCIHYIILFMCKHIIIYYWNELNWIWRVCEYAINMCVIWFYWIIICVCVLFKIKMEKEKTTTFGKKWKLRHCIIPSIYIYITLIRVFVFDTQRERHICTHRNWLLPIYVIIYFKSPTNTHSQQIEDVKRKKRASQRDLTKNGQMSTE